MKSGYTTIYIEQTEDMMGSKAAQKAVSSLKEAFATGATPVMWMMAAPSGFAFYSSFVKIVKQDVVLQEVIKKTHFFQFDDYPIVRNDKRFPITFRHLLETHFFTPLERLIGKLSGINYLELTGEENDVNIAEDYKQKLIHVLIDPSYFVLQIKGIGMDGHWGFHGSETPLHREPMIMKVPINELNKQQQMLDWPEFFSSMNDVPPFAYTCTVSLFMKADMIIDLVPQSSKAFSILATYGIPTPHPLIPSSLLITHKNSYSFITKASSWALLDYLEKGELTDQTIKKLLSVWDNPSNKELENHNKKKMLEIIEVLF